MKGRKLCRDHECLRNARKMCDYDDQCLGISWNRKDVNRDNSLFKCLSTIMENKTEGWRTILKIGTG